MYFACLEATCEINFHGNSVRVYEHCTRQIGINIQYIIKIYSVLFVLFNKYS
jgi:hypothetical protein